MNATQAPLHLTAVGMAGVELRIGYHGEDDARQFFHPEAIQVRTGGIFLAWPDSPAHLEQLDLEWSNSPFSSHTFRCRCTCVQRTAKGVLVAFERPTPVALRDWFSRMDLALNRQVPEAAFRASRLYTRATIVSASGLLCGALGILLPIIGGGEQWVDTLSKVMLFLMVASIGGFAGIRFLAGRAEVQAIQQSQS